MLHKEIVYEGRFNRQRFLNLDTLFAFQGHKLACVSLTQFFVCIETTQYPVDKTMASFLSVSILHSGVATGWMSGKQCCRTGQDIETIINWCRNLSKNKEQSINRVLLLHELLRKDFEMHKDV